jgi:integrase
MMLDDAVKRQMIRKNPAKAVPRPSPPSSKAVAYTSEQIRSLLDASNGDRLSAFLTLLVFTGMRRGEALALRWSDVKIQGDVSLVHIGGTLSRIDGRLVRTEPKTEAGRRAVPLIEPAVKALASVRTLQARDKLRLGEAWAGDDWVFTTEEGKPVDPRNALRWFYMVRNRAGLTEGSLHSLRHSAASTLLEAGVPMPEIRDILGHSSIAVTVDLYGHLSHQHLQGAMKKGLIAYGQ